MAKTLGIYHLADPYSSVVGVLCRMFCCGLAFDFNKYDDYPKRFLTETKTSSNLQT